MSTDYFPLSNSYLCVDCHVITSSSMQCPCCASKNSLMSLATVLSRESEAFPEGLSRAITELNIALTNFQ